MALLPSIRGDKKKDKHLGTERDPEIKAMKDRSPKKVQWANAKLRHGRGPGLDQSSL